MVAFVDRERVLRAAGVDVHVVGRREPPAARVDEAVVAQVVVRVPNEDVEHDARPELAEVRRDAVRAAAALHELGGDGSAPENAARPLFLLLNVRWLDGREQAAGALPVTCLQAYERTARIGVMIVWGEGWINRLLPRWPPAMREMRRFMAGDVGDSRGQVVARGRAQAANERREARGFKAVVAGCCLNRSNVCRNGWAAK